VKRGDTLLLRFAVPLQEGQTVDPTFRVAPFVESGRVVGVLVDAAALEERVVTAVISQPLASHAGGVPLAAPIAAGRSLQIIDGDLGGGARLRLDQAPSFEQHVGYAKPSVVSDAAREEARRLTGYEAKMSGAAIYLRGDDVVAAHGLVAKLESPRGGARGAVIALGALFAGLVAVLLVAMRRLQHAASVEHADAVLAAELDGLRKRAPRESRGLAAGREVP
jgi:hypothetical protein